MAPRQLRPLRGMEASEPPERSNPWRTRRRFEKKHMSLLQMLAGLMKTGVSCEGVRSLIRSWMPQLLEWSGWSSSELQVALSHPCRQACQRRLENQILSTSSSSGWNSGCMVSPTYCMLHKEHSTKQARSTHLQHLAEAYPAPVQRIMAVLWPCSWHGTNGLLCYSFTSSWKTSICANTVLHCSGTTTCTTCKHDSQTCQHLIPIPALLVKMIPFTAAWPQASCGASPVYHQNEAHLGSSHT